MRKTLFLVSNDLNTEQRGLHKAVLKQARLLNQPDYQPVLVTLDYKPNYAEIERELHVTGHLPHDVHIVNLYDYYRDRFAVVEVSAVSKAHYEKNRHKFEDEFFVEDAGNHARYFENGRYAKYKRWDEDGRLQFVDYFNDNRVRISREEFHPAGYKAREILYHPANNKKNQESYFTPDGFCYLTIWFNYLTGGQQRVFLFDPKIQKAFDFKNRLEFQTFWVNELCRLESVRPIIVAETERVADRVLGVEDQYADKIFVVEHNHLEEPYTVGSSMPKFMKSVVNAIPKGYATVVSTEKQQLDLHSDVGNRGNIHVIPPTVEAMPSEALRDPNRFVMVTRLIEDKQVQHAIKAMKQVIAEEPDARLDIYGVGNEEANLQELIAEEKLEKVVTLKGYHPNVADIYQQALASIITAKTEGLNYAYAEAAIQGTPTISYAITYGPTTYITHNENGILVEPNNIEQLATSMIEAIQNSDHMLKLGAAAKQHATEHFAEATYKERWQHVLHQAVHHSPKINMI